MGPVVEVLILTFRQRNTRTRGEVSVMDGKRLLTNDVFDSDSDPEARRHPLGRSRAALSPPLRRFSSLTDDHHTQPRRSNHAPTCMRVSGLTVVQLLCCPRHCQAMGGTDRALSVSPPKAVGRIRTPAEATPAFELTSESSIAAAATPSSLRECPLPQPARLGRSRSVLFSLLRPGCGG